MNLIKCTDRLPGWEEINELVIIKLVEVDSNLIPLVDGTILYTTAKLKLSWNSDVIYFDLVDVWGDADYEFYSDVIEPEDTDLYYSIKSGYKGWLRDNRKYKDFMIESWQLITNL